MPKSAVPLLAVRDLHISVEGKEVLRGLSLEVFAGEVHAVMGPNGSGKSTFVNALMGHPNYRITQGSALFRGRDLLDLSPDARAKLGLFLAFQYPKEIAGVSLRNFLFAAHREHVLSREDSSRRPSPLQFQKLLTSHMQALGIAPAFAERFVNQGFSGGEKKKAEILQCAILRPALALLDETDSGLDVDALKIVAQGISSMRSPSFSALLVTHYPRILEYVVPDRVHVMIGGRIVESGDATLAGVLEREGYAKYGVRECVRAC